MALIDTLLNEDERILHFATTESPVFNVGAVMYSMVAPISTPVDHLDLGACIEDTLHRMLDAGASDEVIERELGAVPHGDLDDDNTYIDLGYVIPGHLTHVE